MKLSVVIPVYNSEQTIGPLVDRLKTCINQFQFEIILVNDGSRDDSEAVCQRIANQCASVTFVSLRRNFGEFNAVLCGLNHAIGEYVVIIDDDFQNPPESILTLLHAAETGTFDVVYSQYSQKHHHWFRNAGSWLVNRLTTWSLGKPRNLYLSSFKLIRRGIVDEICRYRGPYPYIDGLIFRVTSHVTSVTVPHNLRAEGRSNYTLSKLISVFLNAVVGYSLWPIRVFTVVGAALLGLGMVAGLVLFLGWLTGVLHLAGWLIMGWAILLATGLNLTCMGILGEYLGKLYLAYSGLPPYVEKNNQSACSMIGRREEYEKMYQLEGQLWWYCALHDRVVAALETHFSHRTDLTILDAGCGTGGLLTVLQQRGYGPLMGLDGSADAVRFCRERGFAVTPIDLTALASLQLNAQYDAIICNDVFGYIPSSKLPVLLAELVRLLKPGGLFITNNNAFRVFRGQHDLAVGIDRRFIRADFEQLMPQAGLRIRTATYWSFLLSPVILLMRQWQNLQLKMGWRSTEEAQSDVYLPAPWLNQTLYRLVCTEQHWLPQAPFGSSLFITAGIG